MMFRSLLSIGAAVLLAAPVMAGDQNPPPWRDPPGVPPDPNKTFQCWTFPTPQPGTPPDPGWRNPHGLPTGPRPIPGGGDPTWFPRFNDRDGVWCLANGDMLEFTIPNWYMPPPFEKEIWVQIKYFQGPPLVDVLFPPVMGGGPPLAGVGLGVPFIDYEIDPFGWRQGVWRTTLPFCPDFEILKISAPGLGNLYIDQVCIDTRCIPTPGAGGLLVAAGLVAVGRRRR